MAIIIFLLSMIASQTTATAVHVPLSSETDRLALLALKDKFANGDRDALPSWNHSLHFCEWQGVTCTRRHTRVFTLQLQNLDLGGTLAPALGNLTFLAELNLTDLNLYGQIPGEIGRLKRLQVLVLAQNNLHGEIPREIGRLKRLWVLDLKKNNLKGEIPMELANCSSLGEIDFWGNNFTGKVPSWFGYMIQLTVLELGENGLVGNIPPTLGNLSSIVTLTLAENHLQGDITHDLGRLLNLEWISLNTNNLSGQVPNAFYNLSNLQVLDISDNQLEFDISFNSFRGPIPPTWGRSKDLHFFGINNNSLIGSGTARDLDFLSSLINCTNLAMLILQGNNLGGVLPDLIGNLSINLYALDMSNNKISGRLPQGIGNLFGLGYLFMDENFLEGTIPDSIGKLQNLGRLSLDENNLSGKIPIAIGNLTMLSEVYMSSNKLEGSIPFTLRYCTNMQTFSCGENNLTGSIPNQTFGYLDGLVNLDLADNSIHGPIPPDFGNLKHLSKLYLYANKLSGVIPVELGACSALLELYLDINFFHESIPKFLASLKSLEILELSNNSFSGTIPHELENLTLLNTLNLSYNQLYGPVPLGGVFSNITIMSLVGNKDLCGGIPQLNFPPCPTFSSNKHKGSLKKKIMLISVIGALLISFLVLSIYCLRKKPKKLSSSPSLDLEHGYLRVSYGELHQATNGFSSSNLVGAGSFGSVYRGTLVHFERPVVVKVLKLQTYGASKSFMAECKALGKLKHRNLVNILTCCSSVDYKGDDFKAIVFEFMPNGSLETLLHNTIEDREPTNLSLNLLQRVNIALHVAFALDYLHNESEDVVVHCDIKPSNILLDDDMVAHLGDFGLARLVHGAASHSSSDGSSSVIKGTIGYVPPEYGAGGAVSTEGDMYSYGILLLEMITAKKPTDTMFGEGLNLRNFCNMATAEGIIEIVDSTLLTPIDEEEKRTMHHQNIEECLVSLASIGVACSQEFPTQRMNIKDVIMELHAIKHKLLP
ncbi:hypothetical protein PIB30_062020 [Stylosanthes scabra]|uniref:Protein kinase domain-containing protein n=1 Tax=Stylosanthes scabra TaxID=79078 RepID=A0ABU6UJS9_9FABA|nr:hypothetical protein [Stylosanthes scabra]